MCAWINLTTITRMKQLSLAQRVQVMQMLVEGCSIRSVVRMTGIHKTTILNLIVALGEACQNFHNDKVRGLAVKRVQADEIWNFCYAKQKNVPAQFVGQTGYGDVWTFVGIDADTKLIITWLCGSRTSECAGEFMGDLADRIITRIQLTTDGLNKYPRAVADAFWGVDFARLIKTYGSDPNAPSGRYSPAKLTAIEERIESGRPDPRYISTSFVERSNLTMRMSMRRATRLTNAFSKKVANHKHMTAIFWTYYNFCRVHMTIKTAPAVKAGLVEKPWTMEDLIGLLDISTAV